MKCKICGNVESNKSIKVREMMFGYRDCFDYQECGNCGVLQLINIPQNIDKYYPSSYNPYQDSYGLISKITIYLFYKVYNYIVFNKSLLIGKTLLKLDSDDNIFFTTIQIGTLMKLLLKSRDFDKDSSILDVGCGSGQFLRILEKMGFKNLHGIDVFTNKNNGTKIKITESTLESYDTELKFDLIFLKDSFEHMDNQLKNLNHLKTLLNGENAKIIISIPIKNDIYEIYGSNWYDIDAPRHFYIHTLKSFKILLNDSGFEIEKIIYDSNFISYVRSEEYKNNISGNDKQSYNEYWRVFFKNNNIDESIFNKHQITEFKNDAKASNKKNLGSHAIFYLKLQDK